MREGNRAGFHVRVIAAAFPDFSREEHKKTLPSAARFRKAV
jgi:hypothetical protein